MGKETRGNLNINHFMGALEFGTCSVLDVTFLADLWKLDVVRQIFDLSRCWEAMHRQAQHLLLDNQHLRQSGSQALKMKSSWSYLTSLLVKMLTQGDATFWRPDLRSYRRSADFIHFGRTGYHVGALYTVQDFACWKALFHHQLSVHAWSTMASRVATRDSFLLTPSQAHCVHIYRCVQGNSRNRPALKVAEAFLLASPAACWRSTRAGIVMECNETLSRIATIGSPCTVPMYDPTEREPDLWWFMMIVYDCVWFELLHVHSC